MGLMDGKICVVTGATSGIGAESARQLAEMGARVVLVGRNQEKLERTVEAIRVQFPEACLEKALADLSRQADIRRLAENLNEQLPRIDVLLNNAGAMFTKRQESADGIELTFALNHLAYFLLTNLLWDRLIASAPSRVVNVSSDAHKAAPDHSKYLRELTFEAIQLRDDYGSFRAYALSKRANILFSRELAARLTGTGVTANSLHPGVVATNFFANNGPVSRVLRGVFDLFSIPVEQGAQTPVYLASSPEAEGITGRYFAKCAEAKPTISAQDPEAARRLWDLSAEWTGLNESKPNLPSSTILNDTAEQPKTTSD